MSGDGTYIFKRLCADLDKERSSGLASPALTRSHSPAANTKDALLHDKPVASEPKPELEQLREELAFFKTCGIIELAVRNPNVASYMAHWERRADTAELALEQIFGIKMAAENSILYGDRLREGSEAVGRNHIIDLVGQVKSAELKNDQTAFNRAIITLDFALDRLRAGSKQ